jgi:hypothetical protein
MIFLVLKNDQNIYEMEENDYNPINHDMRNDSYFYLE